VTIAERILRDVRRPFEYQEHRIVASVSIGLVFYQPQKGSLEYETVEDILRDADIAMYRAKASGKDRFVTFEINLRDEAMQRLLLENELRRAIEAQEFCLHYQPIYNLTNHHLIGFEALIRWQHPKKGMIYPAEFIPLAEETGLIVPIGEWVLREACRQAQSWRTQSAHLDQLVISVNISGRQLISPYLESLVNSTLQATGLPSRNLALEISENAVMENLNTSSDILNALSQVGVRFFVDDFGTGYSSLGRLQILPIDAIKIDRTFISQMKPGGAGGEIVRAVINMCKELNINIISEGIELSHQLDGLLDLDCRLGQGYLLSPSVDAQAAWELLDISVTSPQPGI
jgi:EAL domain-containing protein (putative c-di-GMP-specific phosphodiesterase class I)